MRDSYPCSARVCLACVLTWLGAFESLRLRSDTTDGKSLSLLYYVCIILQVSNIVTSIQHAYVAYISFDGSVIQSKERNLRCWAKLGKAGKV